MHQATSTSISTSISSTQGPEMIFIVRNPWGCKEAIFPYLGNMGPLHPLRFHPLVSCADEGVGNLASGQAHSEVKFGVWCCVCVCFGSLVLYGFRDS